MDFQESARGTDNPYFLSPTKEPLSLSGKQPTRRIKEISCLIQTELKAERVSFKTWNNCRVKKWTLPSPRDKKKLKKVDKQRQNWIQNPRPVLLTIS